jgi:hypothetical protein
MNLKE